MTRPLAVRGTGMVTGVGLSAASTCAAIRSAIDNFRRSGFIDGAGEMLLASEVPLGGNHRGASRLRRMAAEAARECLTACPQADPASTALLLCLAEKARPGTPLDEAQLLAELQQELGVRFHLRSAAIAQGHVALATAWSHAQALLDGRGPKHVLLVATDSLLSGAAIAHYEADRRLLTSENSDGFIPGEAAAAVLLQEATAEPEPRLVCTGIGFGMEQATIDSDTPLRAEGLTLAITEALRAAGHGEGALKFKIIDAAGAQYQFKEASLAFSRLDRTKRAEFELWHPADCIGEVGAAIGAVMVAVLYAAFTKRYACGTPVLMHLGNDSGERAALVFAWEGC